MDANPKATVTAAPNRAVLLVFLLAIMLGGGNAVAIRFAVAELPPFWAAVLRFGGAALILWLIVLVRRTQLPPRRALPGLLLYGFFSCGAAWAFIYWGLRTVEAGMAQVLMALTPLLTLFLALLHRQESFRWRGLAGALIAVAGVSWAFLEHPGGSATVLPMLAVVAGAACLSESLVLLKQLPAMDSLMTNAIGMSTGSVFLMLLSQVFGETWRLPALARTGLAVIYIIVIGSVVFFSLLIFVVKRWTASASSYGLVLMPFETVALSAWLAGEQLSPSLLLGGALVLFGVWVGALSGRPRPATAPSRVPAPAAGEAD